MVYGEHRIQYFGWSSTLNLYLHQMQPIGGADAYTSPA